MFRTQLMKGRSSLGSSLGCGPSYVCSVHYACETARMLTTRYTARHRFTTYYGEPHARLDRDQRRLGPRVAQRPWWMRGLSAALLSAPEQLATEMDLLYVDELLYTNEWRKFIKSRMSDWRQSSVYAAATLMYAPCFSQPSST